MLIKRSAASGDENDSEGMFGSSQKWRRSIDRIDREMNHPFKVILLQRFQKLYRKVSKVSLSLRFRAVNRRSQNVKTNNLTFG